MIIVSSFFADIFRNNCLNNGVLPVQVTSAFLSSMFDTIKKNSKAEFKVDLANQVFTNQNTGESIGFEISPYKKECLQNGYDDIDYLINLKEKVLEFENERA